MLFVLFLPTSYVILLPPSSLFMASMQASRTNDIYSLDLTKMQWSARWDDGPAAPMPRSWHAAHLLEGAQPQLFICGGRSASSEELADAWLLCLRTRTWRACAPMPVSRQWHTLCPGTYPNELLLYGCASAAWPMHHVPVAATRTLLSFVFGPSPLYHHCVDVVARDRGLQLQLQYLPPSLQMVITDRQLALGLRDVDEFVDEFEEEDMAWLAS